MNQVLRLGIPDTMVALGGQYYYKEHSDIPDVVNIIFSYPKKGLALTYDGSLKNGVCRQSQILSSEATMNIDNVIMLFKDSYSE